MELKQIIEGYIRKYHFLYPYDIKNIIKSITQYDHIKEELMQASEKELKNLLKYLDSMLLYVDIQIFDGNGLQFLLQDIDYLPTPSFQRTQLVSALITGYIVKLKEVMNNNIIDNRKLLCIDTFPQVNNKNKKEVIEKRVIFFPELVDLYDEWLSEYCYKNLRKLVFSHIWDFKKDCIKLIYKIIKADEKTKKAELCEVFIHSPTEMKSLVFDGSLCKNYDFENYANGSNWKNIYNIVKEYFI